MRLANRAFVSENRWRLLLDRQGITSLRRQLVGVILFRRSLLLRSGHGRHLVQRRQAVYFEEAPRARKHNLDSRKRGIPSPGIALEVLTEDFRLG